MLRKWLQDSKYLWILTVIVLAGLLVADNIFNPTNGPTPNNGSSRINFPVSHNFHGDWAVAVDPTGNIYISGTSSISKYGPDWDYMGEWGTPDSDTYLTPRILVPTPQGDFYGLAFFTINDINQKTPPNVQKLNSQGQVLTSWGGNGTEDGKFDSPYKIAVDPAGMVYVLDQAGSKGRIQEFDAGGKFVSKWLGEDPAFPQELKVFNLTDAAGNIYRANTDAVLQTDSTGYQYYSSNNFIEKRDLSGNLLAQWVPKSPKYDADLKRIAVNKKGQVYALLDYGPPPFVAYIMIYDSDSTLLGYISGDGKVITNHS